MDLAQWEGQKLLRRNWDRRRQLKRNTPCDRNIRVVRPQTSVNSVSESSSRGNMACGTPGSADPSYLCPVRYRRSAQDRHAAPIRRVGHQTRRCAEGRV
jgi:hypothetical protein